MVERLIREVMRMLCAGVVHGDLSAYNVLVGADGPVLIDFPQSVDTAKNTNARRLLLRDVDNLHAFLRRFVPGARRVPYAEEMWDLYQQNLLTPETRLGGRYRAPERRVNTAAVLDLIQDADRDERKRRDALGLRGGPAAAPEERRRPPPGGLGPNDRPRQGSRAQGPPPQGGPRPGGPHPRGSRPGDRAPRDSGPPRDGSRQDPPRHGGERNAGPPAQRSTSRTEHVSRGPRGGRPAAPDGQPKEARQVEVIVRHPRREPR
jgi:RIO kinase 1